MSVTHSLAKAIRQHALRMVHKANASHIGSCLSMADILAVLYGRPVLRYRANDPQWTDRDILLVSKGHACAIVYATLAKTGYFDPALLDGYCTNGSLLQGHLSHHVPGVELSTGSLGHALSVGCGLALASKRAKTTRRVFVIVSDGELDEGSNWEAILFAGHQMLGNLTVIVDYNKIQSFGSTAEVLDLEPMTDKWRSFRWRVHELDGHDHNALESAFRAPPVESPTVIVAHTIKGKGVGFMEGKLEWHYKSPSAQLLAQALAEIEAAP
ncbi:MAG: transketolase [Candidatus Sungbacteria bacterium]|uniref:Transketolase n=1 Tax=Candidatus Sungiibacteriota bacterium TaxID=2750080 RepID=A0A932R2H9_9BACT|nr:transketolase [Candidatus Sungbacteria bacterium]